MPYSQKPQIVKVVKIAKMFAYISRANALDAQKCCARAYLKGQICCNYQISFTHVALALEKTFFFCFFFFFVFFFVVVVVVFLSFNILHLCIKSQNESGLRKEIPFLSLFSFFFLSFFFLSLVLCTIGYI